MSMTRLQNSSHARAMPPLHTMKSRWVRTSRLNPRMYAWYTPIRSGSSGVQCWLPPRQVRTHATDGASHASPPVHRQEAVRLEQAPLRLRAAVLGHAVQRGGHAPAPHRLEEVQHPLAVQRGLRHERQDLLRPQLALHQRVPVEHGPHQREHVGGGVRVAREPESHHIAQLVDVVRGHHQHARRLVLQHALARGPLVWAQGMQGESLAQTVHGLKNARGGGYICAIGQCA